MHGIILSEFHKFVVEQHGADSWSHAAQRAHLLDVTFTPAEIYPDEFMAALIDATESTTNVARSTLLESFGKHLTPRLLSSYQVLLKPTWRTLDVIEHTEQTVHRVVRMRDQRAAPPRLRAVRMGPTEVILTYDSERGLCAMALGIAKGIARHFGEELVVSERTCMLRGDPCCVFAFIVTEPAPGPE